MTEPRYGVFLTPDAEQSERTLQRAIAADHLGLDLIGIQDHPYQRRFLDTFSLLAFIAATTERIRLTPDVANLPLRPPAVLAKAAASIDLLSGGRFELGLGAGGFLDTIAAMGGPRRTPKQSVDALEEAIAVIRLMWSGERAVSFDGEHYQLKGLKPGPPPAHPIGIWLGAYGPRMVRLTGRLADGWLPSVPQAAQRLDGRALSIPLSRNDRTRPPRSLRNASSGTARRMLARRTIASATAYGSTT
jgi:alkanesulfonate monooxygenase SsuD/methylene tetrahydromethanopterin reductase-like flavin-dependent oxidoreductase (luciferase family)